MADDSLSVKDFNQISPERFTVSDWHYRFKLRTFFNLIHNRYVIKSFLRSLNEMIDLFLNPNPNSCFLVKTGATCFNLQFIIETLAWLKLAVLLDTETTVLYCPSKISTLIFCVCIVKTNLLRVKKKVFRWSFKSMLSLKYKSLR